MLPSLAITASDDLTNQRYAGFFKSQKTSKQQTQLSRSQVLLVHLHALRPYHFSVLVLAPSYTVVVSC